MVCPQNLMVEIASFHSLSSLTVFLKKLLSKVKSLSSECEDEISVRGPEAVVSNTLSATQKITLAQPCQILSLLITETDNVCLEYSMI